MRGEQADEGRLEERVRSAFMSDSGARKDGRGRVAWLEKPKALG